MDEAADVQDINAPSDKLFGVLIIYTSVPRDLDIRILPAYGAYFIEQIKIDGTAAVVTEITAEDHDVVEISEPWHDVLHGSLLQYAESGLDIHTL